MNLKNLNINHTKVIDYSKDPLRDGFDVYKAKCQTMLNRYGKSKEIFDERTVCDICNEFDLMIDLHDYTRYSTPFSPVSSSPHILFFSNPDCKEVFNAVTSFTQKYFDPPIIVDNSVVCAWTLCPKVVGIEYIPYIFDDKEKILELDISEATLVTKKFIEYLLEKLFL